MTAAAKINIQIVFKAMDSSQAVKDYAEKRALKFTKHLHAITNCHFVFNHDKKGYTAHLHVTAGDFEARAEGFQGDNLYAAIDEVTEKILQQTRKFKEKASDHSGEAHHNGQADSPADYDGGEE